MNEQPTGKREAGKLARRDRLYDAAVTLFREQGYEHTTVDQITRRAGVAKGTFFNYFPTKDAVLRYMGAREIGRLGAATLAGGSTSAVGNLKRFMAALATGMEGDRELVKLIFARGMAVPDLMCGDAGGFSVQPTTSFVDPPRAASGRNQPRPRSGYPGGGPGRALSPTVGSLVRGRGPVCAGRAADRDRRSVDDGHRCPIGDRLGDIASTHHGGSDRLDAGSGPRFVPGSGNAVRLDCPVRACRRRPAPRPGGTRCAGARCAGAGWSSLWQRNQDGLVYVNATALAEAARRLHGAAWLGPIRGETPAGLLGRLQTRSVIREAQTRIAADLSEVSDIHGRVAKWLEWVRGLRWTQADLLQVMEELEPRARDALQAYFILRAGLSAAATQVTDRLAAWLPERPPDVTWGLYIGLAGLPGVEAAYALAVAARDEASRAAALARFGHRGPGEMRPDGARWADHPALLASLADQRPLRNNDSAHNQRQAIEAWVFGQLDASKSRQFEASLRRAQALCAAADVAWDAVTMVMAAVQRWSEATASEAVAAELIERPADVLYLELEELKQVATGEWHPGRSAAVQDAVARRRARIAAHPAVEPGGESLPAGPGQAHGPAYLASPATGSPPLSAIWLTDAADPGCAPFWLGAGAVVTAAADPWSPGLIVARGLGVPAVIGAAEAATAARPGQAVAVDGDTGQVSLDIL